MLFLISQYWSLKFQIRFLNVWGYISNSTHILYMCVCAHTLECTYVHMSVGFCLFIVLSMQFRGISFNDTDTLPVWSQYLKVVEGVMERWLSSWKHLLLLLGTWDQILGAHTQPDVAAHVCNPSTSTGRQEVKTEPLEAQVQCTQQPATERKLRTDIFDLYHVYHNTHMPWTHSHTWTPTQRLKKKEWRDVMTIKIVKNLQSI